MMVTHDNRIIELADRIVNMVDGAMKSDVVVRDAVMICEFLRTVDLFKHLTPTELTSIAEKMKRRRYGKDETIIRGESGARRVLALDPDQPVFLWPEANVKLSDLRRPDTAILSSPTALPREARTCSNTATPSFWSTTIQTY
jgi:hypothetical protein